MRLWSKGLGKLILPFYLDEAEQVDDFDEYVLIKGRIVEKKVNWPYKIFLFPYDMVKFTRFMADDKTILSFLKRNLRFRLISFLVSNLLKVFLIITPKVVIWKLFRKREKKQEDELILKVREKTGTINHEESSEKENSGQSADAEESERKLYQGGMIFWSKGLGIRSHLVIPCGTEKPEDKGDVIVLHGKTLPPVVWIYTMTMTPDDFLSILKVGLSEVFVRFLLSPRKIPFAFQLLFQVIKIIIKLPFVPSHFPSEHAETKLQREQDIKSAETRSNTLIDG
ncbi:hypothetical protein HRbin19_00012 [bacterium HR19]|nr:hypothetical protein HRbin19_00012 [bacterium HR19]